MMRLGWVGPLVMSSEELARLPAKVPGVYLLHVFVAALGGYPVIYTGKSIDLRRRLYEHFRSPTAGFFSQDHRIGDDRYFSAAPVTPVLLDAVEAGLVRLLQPPCNMQLPSADPILVSLPPMSLLP